MSTPSMHGTTPCDGAEGRCTDVSDSSGVPADISLHHDTLGQAHHTTPHHTKTWSLIFCFPPKPKIGPRITKMLTTLSVMSRGSVMGHYENVWSTVQAKCPNRMKMMVD